VRLWVGHNSAAGHRPGAGRAGAPGWMPPSPWIGSTNTAAVCPFLITAAAASRSLGSEREGEKQEQPQQQMRVG
jgi:hypothetical protein